QHSYFHSFPTRRSSDLFGSIPQMIPASGNPPEPSKSEPKVSLRTFTHLKFAISNLFIISNNIHTFICSNLFNVSFRYHITKLFIDRNSTRLNSSHVSIS